MIRVRAFRCEDAPDLYQIFQRAVNEGAKTAYDDKQRRAWAGAAEAKPDWPDRLGRQITVVAQDAEAMVGFMTLGHDGHLDLAFVVPEAMGTGVADALHDRLLSLAQSQGMTLLTTDASYLARRFFLKKGWREIAEQKVSLGGVYLTNFRMEKLLSSFDERSGTGRTGPP